TEYGDLFAADPRAAALKWFENARLGIFIHYGLYSIPGRGEWIMYKEKYHVSEYEKLMSSFTAEKFDADHIASLAEASGMKYIIFTTRHHDGFCLFKSNESDFNSYKSPAGRDLVAELAEACKKKGIGLFLYYSYGVDWRHPCAPGNDAGVNCARPLYDEPEPYNDSCRSTTGEGALEILETKETTATTATTGTGEQGYGIYIDFMHRQLTELLTNYGNIAGIWLDLISAVYFRPDIFPVSETYKLIRSLQPHALISFKQGANGEEDYMSQEFVFVPLKDRLIKMGAPEEAVRLSEEVWNRHKDKWNEVCAIMQDKGWGYIKDEPHKSADDISKMLAECRKRRCNLAINTGLLPDGSVHADDEKAFREVGRRLK
ncbi:MAG: alpha-L-fucosidase, partial [Eubacteriales bacterium]|nr:alpha-L-fucosidase [Eubacteriales bacterium]